MRGFWLGSAVILVMLTAFIIRQSQYALSLQTQVTQTLTPAGKTNLYGKALLETVSLGVYDGASKEIAAAQGQIAAWQQAQRVIGLATGGFVLVAVLLLGSVLVAGRAQPPGLTWHILSVHTLGLSLLLFLLGITTPLVTMSMTMTIPGLGSALITATTNGMLSAINKLWSGSHQLLALLVFIFSVALPLIKLSLAGWVLVGARLPLRVVRVLQLVGKWSMADVFVVAVVIALLSPLGQGRIVQTQTQAGMGLYFFAASCVLSMVTTVLLRRRSSTPALAPQVLDVRDDTYMSAR